MIGLIIGLSIFGVLLILLILVLIKSIKRINQTEFLVIERLGKFHKVLENGLRIIVPFLDKVVKKSDYKEKVIDFPEQDVITKDNAGIRVDTVVYLQITDPKAYAYGHERPLLAIENIVATTLRNLLGELELDETLTSRDTINSKLTLILDEASDPWGVKVNRVEIKNITPPKEILISMEKQMRAEREKRANILQAEGLKEAQILRAEGDKAAQLLKAEADRESEILRAQGQKEAIELLNSSKISNEILVLKSLEELGKLANGKGTKVILPPNLADIAKTMTVASTIAVNSNTEDQDNFTK
ncbi:SPFH domain-containing protein [Mycoplasmopsis felis]|uniref:SPFH domain-containing protein n=1 Tax=Mycoplasmopsis felis TaxID=33923 RepID=UPI002B000806|nr:SPFH domain-containing protein [Mycoplasmopsis felis]WQQ03452.1 SPFH domain-containing protein [Mycoplasmopsis felis]WQQ04366.1 SPFH domain-containing protein [Mycoplasmopsis felis]